MSSYAVPGYTPGPFVPYSSGQSFLGTAQFPAQPQASSSSNFATTSGFGFHPQPIVPPQPQEPPDLTSITPNVASKAMERILSLELRDANFSSAQPAVLRRLEIEVAAYVEKLYRRAHDYSNLGGRSGPVASDLLQAAGDYGVDSHELYRAGLKKARKRKQYYATTLPPATLLPSSSRSPSPDLLGSDDEEAPPVVPQTLRSLPSYFPHLPPKHTYLRTPLSPPKKAAIPSLEKKLKTAGLVQDSLKNLLLATEDNTNQVDSELLGHIVNCEQHTGGAIPRKRWKKLVSQTEKANTKGKGKQIPNRHHAPLGPQSHPMEL